MKKIYRNQLQEINGGNCTWIAFVSAVGWVGSIFFAPLVWLGVAGAAGYVFCETMPEV